MGSTVVVEGPDGRAFEAGVDWPTEHSVFLETVEVLGYGQTVRFRLHGAMLSARVAFVSFQPAGVVVTFSAPVEVEESLRLALEERVQEAPEPTSPEWRESTEVPEFDPSFGAAGPDGQEVPTHHDFDAGSAEGSTGAELQVPDWTENFTSGGGGEGSSEGFPTLEADGFTVRFRNLAQFRAQCSGNLVHGGLVVAHEPLPVGNQRMLKLRVPDRPDYTVSARVVFNQPGAVGFMVDSIQLHRERLQQMAGS